MVVGNKFAIFRHFSTIPHKLRVVLCDHFMMNGIISPIYGRTATQDDKIGGESSNDEDVDSNDAGADTTMFSPMKGIVGNGRYESVLAAGTSDGTKKRRDAALIHIKAYLAKVEYRTNDPEKLSADDMSASFWEGFACFLGKDATKYGKTNGELLMYNSADTALSQCKVYFQSEPYCYIIIHNTVIDVGKWSERHFHFLEGSHWAAIRMHMRSMFALRCKLTGQRMVKPHAATTSNDLLALSKVFVLKRLRNIF